MTSPARGLAVAVAALGATLVLAVTAEGAKPVTTCGTVLKGAGELTGDLDCSGSPEAAVVLESGSSLRLRGFTLTAKGTGVSCRNRCRVVGPGRIVRSSPAYQPNGTCVGGSGVVANHATLTDVELRSFSHGVTAFETLRATRATVADGCFGFSVGRSAAVVSCTVVDNAGYGVRSLKKLVVRRSTITGQPRDLIAPVKPLVRDTTCVTSADETSPLFIDFWGVCGS